MNVMKRVQKQIDRTVGGFILRGAVTEEPVPFSEREGLVYKEYKVGDSWGKLFDCAWFHLTGKVDPAPGEPVFLKLDMNCEALLYDREGNPLKGFTNGSSVFGFMGYLGDPGKYYYPLENFTDGQGNVELWIDAGMNDLFGNVKKKGRIEIVEMVTRDMNMRALYYDLKVLRDLKIGSMKLDREAFRIYRKGLMKVRAIINRQKPGWVSEALELTEELLKTPSKLDHQISSIGHAHLDLAWLWPIRETWRKGARTFANVLRLMEDYPDFKFGASQPQLYQWVKDQHPGLYEEVKQRVAEGRWEVQGGMWVEADTNVSGEEALVRQMLYGIRFFQKEFGIRVDSLWLPDVFGYSGNMPQIIKKSGLDNFMTIKISWNDTNKFPHHTFNWQGIDGSEVFAHMPPEGEYNSPANVYFLLKSARNYREKHIDNRTLNLFGVGDGGGGPAASHVERIRRLNGTAPMPRVKMEFARDFFSRLSMIKEKFPSYRGELYLEKHRGTYTSQGWVKYYNRRMEQKLKTLETLLVQTGRYGEFKEEVRAIWKEVLLYQFHDILPGSSIKRVYKECLERYEALDKQTDEIFRHVTGQSPLSSEETVSLKELSAYNPLPVPLRAQRFTGQEYQELHLSPLSSTVRDAGSWKREASENNRMLENDRILVKFNRRGAIASIRDKKSGRKVLRGTANRLTVYSDIANAWDIFRFYRLLPKRHMKLIESRAFRYGPVREIVQRYVYGRSRMTQIIRLRDGESRLDFELHGDWQNNKKMVRTAFPLNLKTDVAVFDIQFGSLKRSARNKTKIERAQYEMCGHNWVDMNDGERGAALFTDSKYGFRTKNNTLDLNLIKSTNYPAKRGDLGLHDIRYAFFVHDGDHLAAKVDEKAMEFNTWIPFGKSSLDCGQPLFELDSEAITYSALKESEDSDALILRLYERNGREERVMLKINRSVESLYETNMVEENPVKICDGNRADLSFGPFEVKTIQILLKGSRSSEEKPL
ncbi:alpha-mannosidase [Spirochaeta isovalerica]|uniref:Alpha-mannosidase n=1 Tax=Spirochaeta isovalerica TaxID=150 RepID=A0A841R7U5_9SPIO|nr:glycoside hydrolase family 38 C-terminal domain-containing protein [Spirochaeta isovalerica]MBB6479935.1 alpha-mannosidase [Spirochaeta isovalerica]